MAQLAFSVAGAAVGFYFGGPTGAKYGWAIGSAIGGVVAPPKGADGPRLGDLTVHSSAYGRPIPRLWGTQRIAGEIIWATPLVEQENEQGGKGGSSYSTYSYSCSFAVALCRGPITCITRIWADGKLIYNIRPENEGETIGFTALSMVVYPGNESQDVDPTIQAYLGDTPAYRGLAYVVFAGLQLERFGNRIPNLTFEVVQVGSTALAAPNKFGEEYENYTFQHDMASDGSLWVSSMEGHVVGDDVDFDAIGVPQVQRWNPITQKCIESFLVAQDETMTDSGNWTAYSIQGTGVCYGDRYYIGRGRPGVPRSTGVTCLAAPEPCGEPRPYVHGYSFGPNGSQIAFRDTYSSGQFQNAFYWPTTPIIRDFAENIVFWMSGNGIGGDFGVGFYLGGSEATNTQACVCTPTRPPGAFGGTAHHSPDWCYGAVKTDTGALMQGYVDTYNSYLASGSDAGTPLPGSGVRMPAAVFDKLRDTVWSFAGEKNNTLYNYTVAAGFAFPDVPGESQGSDVRGVCVDTATGNLRILIGGSFGATPRLLLFNPDTFEIIEDVPLPAVYVANTTGKLYDLPGKCRVIYADGYYIWSIPYCSTCEPTAVPLWQIVQDISLEAGLTVDEIDTTELTDLVLGFVVARQGSARSAIETLMSTFYFDAVESEGKVKFTKRGKPPVLAIADDDLSAHAMTGEPPPPLSLTRADEADLPRVMGVRYINPDNDYQVNVQSAKRMTGLATAEVLIEAPVVLPDSYAKALADAALYSAWAARTAARWSTTWKYAHVEPNDVVTISDNPILVRKVTRADNLLSFEGVFDSGQTFTGGALSGSVYPIVAPTPVEAVALSALLLLDIPIVLDAHDGPGYYAAVSPYGTPWTGAAITKSDDGGGTFNTIDSSSTAAVQGAAVDALGDFSANVFDEFNTVTVTATGTLSSNTEIAVLNGANLALLGNELIQFKRATLNLDDTYTLSGLLRGRAGTPTAGHIGGDRFVLIDAAVRRQAGAVAEIGLSRQYKAVSFGSTYESAATVFFTNTGQGLECLAGVLLGGGRDAAGNLTIQWTRRTRVDGQWRDYVDAGLGEAVESYEVEVYETASYITVLRTIASATPTVTYTAAQQVTDFGSEQGTVYVRVYQLSATVARGAKLEGAV